MNLRLRELEDPAERIGLLTLFLRAWTEGGGEPPDGDGVPLEEQVRAFLDQGLAPAEARLVVAEDPERKVVGLACSARFTDPFSGEPEPMLLLVWVDPTLRHRGIARGLVGEVRRLLERAGHTRLLARVPHGDDPLLAMGERWGLVRSWEILAG